MPNRTEYLWPSPIARPPTLGPRRRYIDPTVARRLCSWIRSVLKAPVDTRVELFEWVSMDSRARPHTLHIVVWTPGGHHYFVFEEPSERVVHTDVRARVTQTKPVPLVPSQRAPNQSTSLPLKVGSFFAPEIP